MFTPFAFIQTLPPISQNDLDFWYDYSLGSYNANYSSSNLAPSVGAYLDFDMSLSGSGTNPTFDTGFNAWLFPSQSNSSIVGKSFGWVNSGSSPQPLPDDVYSIFVVFKPNIFPAYNVDYNTIFELTETDTMDLRIAYQANLTNRPVIEWQVSSYDAIWDATGFGVDFTNWAILQIDYSSANNPSGNAQLYINNKTIGNAFLAVGLSTNKDAISVAESFGGYIGAVGGYDRILSAAERNELHSYYMRRYNIPS
jgi:hypothetical protein